MNIKWGLILGVAALLAIGLGGTAYAFHSGGVAECTGCHSMHSPKAGGTFLLVGSDQSSTCLSCHEHAGDTGPSSYHISTADADMPAGVPPKQRTPGGDFGWLKKTYNFTLRGTATTDPGERNGHNVVALDKSYVADSTNTTAPGGTYPAAQLACNSCHDPHSPYRRLQDGSILKPVIGQSTLPIKASGSYASTSNEPTATEAVGVYRLLGGNGYSRSVVGVIGFPGVPAAKVPSTYNATEASAQIRVAYGVGTGTNKTTWGLWCGTCHPNMHSTGNYVHPVDQGLGSTVQGNYNAYVKSGDLSGTQATAFSSLTPFASNTGDYSVLITKATSTVGPDSSDQVVCLSCHRAHASGWAFALRWNMEGELITAGGEYPGTDATSSDAQKFARGRLKAETQAAYYDRPITQFATYQRVLCNKCHAKD